MRYLTATAPHHRRVIESVRTPGASPEIDDVNLLGVDWRCTRSAWEDGVLRLHASKLWPPSEAEQPVALLPATRYRIALEVRGPEGGAAHFVRAEIREDLGGDALGFDANPFVLMVYPEQTGADWRRFTWDLVTPEALPDALTFRIYSMSERPVEVRDVSMRRAVPYQPVGVPEDFGADAHVYVEVAEIAPLREGDEPVRIYENRLCRDAATRALVRAEPATVEALKWDPTPWLEDATRPLPDLGFTPPAALTRWLLFATVPALVLYGLLLVAHRVRRRRRHTA